MRRYSISRDSASIYSDIIDETQSYRLVTKGEQDEQNGIYEYLASRIAGFA